MKTQSEKLFEDFCKRNNIACKSISVQSSRTPDYCISVNGEKIIVEVKEISPNKEDRVNDNNLRHAKSGYVSVVGIKRLGSRAQHKIAKSAKQISNLSRDKYPGLLVLYSSIISVNPLDPYQLKVAMFGIDTMVLSRPGSMNEMPDVLEKKSGPNRKLTPNANTSISAIAVLTENSNAPDLTVYHNHHAAIRIPSAVFGKIGCPQFVLDENNKDEFPSWRQLSPIQLPSAALWIYRVCRRMLRLAFSCRGACAAAGCSIWSRKCRQVWRACYDAMRSLR